ncbi:translocation protein SEC62 isoform X2 [Drosophila busckii]|uniref:translocation protein SEC62 isoform X2 n=1 Tax=Drosophila busckii TaxID=30019 RepID=UPI00083F2E28|nr:translocation protein SEC62 isoform X2 [Drosophila busckii]XP_017853874.1 translocation protein SEC62 isoform X2 [Drosophila busckii]XP_017853875.1 translocation protein SEC62 isoform X2 [Drosophila busckii]
MSEKKRTRRRKDEYTEPGQTKDDKPSNDEKNVAKWLKKNVKTKKTKFLSHVVEYFTSSKAIDGLMKSKFAEGDKALFTTREQAVEFLDIMLEHKFFHRAKKVPVTLDELRGKSEKKSEAGKTQEKDKTEAAGGKGKAGVTDKKDTDQEAEGDNQGSSDKKEKKKRKIRLDMHPEQIFVDGSEAYVWIYDPIPLHYWIFGFILLLGAVGICLFPLWPPLLRKGVYYLSIAAAGFLVFILALTVVRLIVFTIVWGLTGGKLHFWIFPNLTEDVGFFASFWPLYESNYNNEGNSSASKNDKKNKLKNKKKDKDSDAEEDTAVDADGDADADVDAEPLEPEKIELIKEHDADMEVRKRRQVGADDYEDEDLDEATKPTASTADKDIKAGTPRHSESDSESSSRDYEIISSSEVQNVDAEHK